MTKEDKEVSDWIENRDRSAPVWGTKYVFKTSYIDSAGKKKRAVGSYGGDYKYQLEV